MLSGFFMQKPLVKRYIGGRGWRGLLIMVCLFPFALRADQVIYDDTLQNGWADWGWGTRSAVNTSPVHSGIYSYSANENAWEALSFNHGDFDSSPYTNLTF